MWARNGVVVSSSLVGAWIGFVVVVVHGGIGIVHAASLSSLPLDNGIFDWVRQKGGSYHEGQEFRREVLVAGKDDNDDDDDGNTKTIAGVFATQDIPKGTVLAKIPWKLIIPSDDLEESGQLCCGLVNRLKRELALGGGTTKSFYAPYIDYVRQLPLTSIPSMWSDVGKRLVAEITGITSSSSSSSKDLLPPDDPVKWLEKEWFPACGGSWDDELGIQAAVIVLTRSDDHILIPGTDPMMMKRIVLLVFVAVILVRLSRLYHKYILTSPPRVRHVQSSEWELDECPNDFRGRNSPRHNSDQGYSKGGPNLYQLQPM